MILNLLQPICVEATDMSDVLNTFVYQYTTDELLDAMESAIRADIKEYQDEYGEHEEGDAHVGHGVHGLRRGNESEGWRSAQDAGEEKAYDGRQTKPDADENDDDGKDEENDDFAKYEFFHEQSLKKKKLR